MDSLSAGRWALNWILFFFSFLFDSMRPVFFAATALTIWQIDNEYFVQGSNNKPPIMLNKRKIVPHFVFFFFCTGQYERNTNPLGVHWTKIVDCDWNKDSPIGRLHEIAGQLTCGIHKLMGLCMTNGIEIFGWLCHSSPVSSINLQREWDNGVRVYECV